MKKTRLRRKSRGHKVIFIGLLFGVLLLSGNYIRTAPAGTSNKTSSENSSSNKTSHETANLYEHVTDGENRVVVLDPGHGGAYAGASYQGFLEKDLTLKLAQYIKAYLETHYEGVSVYLTRNDDALLSDNAAEDLEKRVELAAGLGAELLVSLHFNAEPNQHSSAGALVCISKQANVNSASEALANSILEQLEQLGLQNRGLLLRDHDRYVDENGAALDYYAICRHSAAAGFPGIIVEHCFMDNPAELQFFGSEDALQRLATADAVGIANYMKLTKID